MSPPNELGHTDMSILFQLVQTLTHQVADLKQRVEVLTAERNNAANNQLLPKFSGNALHWARFFAAYQELVGMNNEFSDITKFRLLFDAVDQQTRALLADVNLISPNLLAVYNRLVKHFSKRHVINHSIVSAVSEMPYMKDAYNNQQWSKLAETANLIKHVIRKAFDSYDCEKQDADAVSKLILKLPPRYMTKY